MTASALAPSAEDHDLELAVIIPCHNVESTLAAQLDALVAQRWNRPWGIVVVDNGSTDGTATVARRYASRGVRVVTATTGRGVAYARNAGVRAVRSHSVAFCDGDDVVHSGWVAAMGEALLAAEIVSGQVETERLNPPWLAASRPMGRPGALPTFGELGFASGCNCGIRRSTFERLDGFDEAFVGLEDIEFSLRALAAGVKIRALPEAVVSYRFRSSLADVWRQGVFYGRGRPHLVQQANRLGLAGPGRFDGWRSLAWLVIRAPRVRTRSGRVQWVWVLANRVGVLRGSLELRRIHL